MFLSYITPREEGCYYLQSTFSLLSILKKKEKKTTATLEIFTKRAPRNQTVL